MRFTLLNYISSVLSILLSHIQVKRMKKKFICEYSIGQTKWCNKFNSAMTREFKTGYTYCIHIDEYFLYKIISLRYYSDFRFIFFFFFFYYLFLIVSLISFISLFFLHFYCQNSVALLYYPFCSIILLLNCFFFIFIFYVIFVPSIQREFNVIQFTTSNVYKCIDKRIEHFDSLYFWGK